MPPRLSIGFMASEAPLDSAPLRITVRLLSADFATQCCDIGQASIQALACQSPDFDFRHVQPARVLGRVMKDHSTQQAMRLRDAEHVLEAFAEVRVQIHATCPLPRYARSSTS